MGHVVYFSVKVHTCNPLRNRGQVLEDDMMPNERYICVKNARKDEKEEKPYLEELKKIPEYYRMPVHCKCRKWTTYHEAVELTKIGQALWAFKKKKGIVARCEPGFPASDNLGHIWRPVVREKVPRIDLISKADVQRAYGLKHEKISARQKEFIDYIELVNLITLEVRGKMVVPFEPDPQQGRVLFLTTGYDSLNNGRSPSADISGCYEGGLRLSDIFHGIRPKE